MTSATPARQPVDPAAGPLPGPLRWLVRLLYAEAAAIAAVALFLGYQDLTGGADLRVALPLTGYAVALAAALGGLAYALSGRRPWARGPVIALHLLFLPVGYYLATGGLPAAGVPLVVLAVLVVGLLLAPSTTRALGIGGAAPGQH